MMEPAHPIFARDLAKSREWYTALLGVTPSIEDYGLRYQLSGRSVVLSPTAQQGPVGLFIPSIEKARARLDQAGLPAGELLGSVTGYDAGETATFHDPSGNMVLLTDHSHLPQGE